MSIRRGRHKIFLGMAPGAGKTYQMVEEAREQRRQGRDVVIGYLEPHGRAETVALAEGLELLPRRPVPYRGITLDEMDLPAILQRRPQLCLVDELAHTNAPGTEHGERSEDVLDLLAAGIDVYSTMNIQHVESLAPKLTALTEVPVSQTVPDSVVDRADEVVLVDVTPELLIERLRTGKIYPQGSPPLAEQAFFAPDRLATLRELSLLKVAAEADPARRQALTAVRAGEGGASGASSERVLALVTPSHRARATVFHAFRAAHGLRAPLDVLWVRDSGGERGLDGDEQTLAALERLVSTLGGTLLVRDGPDIVAATAEVARQRGATYIVVGTPRQRMGLQVLRRRRDLSLELIRALPGVDVQVASGPR